MMNSQLTAITKHNMCQYFDNVVVLARKLKELIAADRDGDWEDHLQAVQELLPSFFEYQIV